MAHKHRSSYGTALRKLRIKSRLTLADLASVARCSIVHLSDIERGERNPPDDETTMKLLKRMDRQDQFEDMVQRAARSRAKVEISVKGKPREVTNVLVALARCADQDELDNQMAAEILAIINKGKTT